MITMMRIKLSLTAVAVCMGFVTHDLPIYHPKISREKEEKEYRKFDKKFPKKG